MSYTPATLVGLAIGDSLGMPFEKPRDEIHPNLATWGGGFEAGTSHKRQAGEGTDDTEMALALAQSLVANGTYRVADVADRYLRWAQDAPTGMGKTTRKAMDNLASGLSWEDSGIHAPSAESVGNGTAMRIAPLGVMYTPYSHDLRLFASVDAAITHRHLEADAASILVAAAVSLAIHEREPQRQPMGLDDIISQAAHIAPHSTVANYAHIAVRVASGDATDDIAVGDLRRGNAVQTVASACFFVCRYPTSFKDAVVAAVRAGGDTDTRGAIVGAIMGAKLGLEGIPDEYLNGLHNAGYLMEVDASLYDLRLRRGHPA